LRIEAYRICIKELQNGFNVEKYDDTVNKLNQELEKSGLQQVDVDLEWISRISLQMSEEQERLERELNSYKGNLIKESIRIGHVELAEHYYRRGDLQKALKYFSNSRDYSTSAQHVVEMCINVIETSMEADNFHHVQLYIQKAMQRGYTNDETETRIQCASAMYQLESFYYQAAADIFVDIKFTSAAHLWKVYRN
jgi:COP9 signalosome complex subunit 1